jgi:hypothetical protein
MVPLGQTRFLQLSLQMVVVVEIQQALPVLLLAVVPAAGQVTQRQERLEQPIKDMLVGTAHRVLTLAAVAVELERLVLTVPLLAVVLVVTGLQVQ